VTRKYLVTQYTQTAFITICGDPSNA